eukprot:GEMP01001071.1.p1 GENE.GEMP01001071.1~~GEMP01001071.1.p1  ORF type:complete len:1332 (+),score=305.72 GEMP01001071.1:166-4161(+)
MLTRDYFSASWWDYLSFRWLDPLLASGVNDQNIGPDDCARLGPEENTFTNVKTFSALLHERRNRSHPLIRAFCSMFWLGLLINECINLTGEVLHTAGPLLLQQLLIFQESQTSAKKITLEEERWGAFAAGGLILVSFFAIIVSTQGGFYKVRLGTRMEQALAGSILLRCNNAMPDDDSKVFNVLNFDVGPNVSIVFVILEMCLFPFQIALHGTLLFRQVGWTFVPGLALVGVVTLTNFCLMFREGQLRDVHLQRKDLRMARTQEVIENARQIQLLERRDMIDRVMDSREQEISVVWRRLVLSSASRVLSTMLASLVTLATFYVYIRKEGKMLKASTVMTVVMFISHLVYHVEAIPVWAQNWLIWQSAYKRVNAYLAIGKETAYPASSADEHDADNGRLDYSLDTGVRSIGATVGFSTGHDDTEGEGQEKILLTRFSLYMGHFVLRPKDKILLTGARGSGKTCFIQAFLGTIDIHEGILALPRELGAVSGRDHMLYTQIPNRTRDYVVDNSGPCIVYVPQRPCVLGKTLKENIILNLPFVAGPFRLALEAVSLREEVMNWPELDETILATKGENISGGQASRIQLARAVYRTLVGAVPPSLVLLDAPYHSIDATTARDIHTALFHPVTGVFRDLLVVFVGETDMVSDEAAWRRFSIVEGRVHEHTQRTSMDESIPSIDLLRDDLETRGNNPQEDEQLGSTTSTTGHEDDANNNNEHVADEHFVAYPSRSTKSKAKSLKENGGSASRIMSTKKKMAHATQQTMPDNEKKRIEHREVGFVKGATYLAYFNAVGFRLIGVTGAALIMLIFFQQASDIFVSYWSDEKRAKGTHILDSTFVRDMTLNVWMAMNVYAVLVVCYCVFVAVGNALEVLGGVLAARRVFKDAFLGTMSRPFAWWDANPQGRVYNRMCADVNTVDEAVTLIFGIVFGAVIYFIGHAIFLCATYWITFLWLPVMLYLFEYVASYYRPNVRELYRISLIQRSPVFQTCVEAIINFPVLHSFGAARWACWDGLLQLDSFKRAEFTLWSVKLWVSLRLGLLTAVMTSINAMYPLVMYYMSDGTGAKPMSAGIVGITIVYTFQLQKVVQTLVFYFSDMEMQMVSVERLQEWAVEDATVVPKNAPFLIDNSLTVRDLSVYYGSVQALRTISFTLNRNDICVITGRTGSGKSSLVLSLVQAIPYTGQVVFGTCNLAQCCPNEFRRRFVAYCSQQPVVFRGTFHFNICPEKSYEAVACAMRAVGLFAKPDDEVNELSGVDQQLLSVARAIVRTEVRLVVLDEVTACLPGQEANDFLRKILPLMWQSTRLIITHQDIDVGDGVRRLHLQDGQIAPYVSAYA